MPSARVSSRKRARIPLAIPSKSHDELVAETYERLGVSPEAVAVLPRIAHILKDLPHGIDQAIEFLRGSADPDARKWLAIYDEVPPSYRNLVPVEAYCLAANLTTKRVLELVTGACFEQSDASASLLAKASKPAIIRATVDSALIPGLHGTQDRKMMHLHEGFVPVPKTSVVNVHGDVRTDNRIQSISIGELSGIESQMAKIANRFNERMVGGEHDRAESSAVIDVSPELESNSEVKVVLQPSGKPAPPLPPTIAPPDEPKTDPDSEWEL